MYNIIYFFYIVLYKDYNNFIMSNNDILKNLIIYITYIIILYIIIEEIYNISILVFNYNYNFDYGLMLRKICNNEYFEYETERFQLYNNIAALRLQNDIYNKKNYMTLLLIFSIFISIIISYIFSEIFYHNFIEKYTNCSYYLNDKDDNSNGGSSFIQIFKLILKCFCPFCHTLLSDCTLGFIIYIFILLLIPLYIVLYFAFNIDIGFFSNYNTKIYKIYATIFILLIILRLPIEFFNKYRYINKDSSIYLYILYIIIYIFIMYFLQNIIKLYNDYDMIHGTNLKNLTNENKFYLYDRNDINDSKDINIFSDIFANIIGFNDMFINDRYGIIGKDGIISKFINANGLQNNIFMDNYSTFLYIIGFIILLTYIIYMLILKFKYLEFLIKRPEDYSIIYNFIILPLFSIFIILLLINCNTIYNSYVNKYILYKPHALYKYDIDKLYKSFEFFLINDRSNLYDKHPVCINVANAIHVVLYSCVFNYNISSIHNNDIVSLDSLQHQYFANTYIQTTPPFKFSNSSCYEYDDTLDYTTHVLYNITNQIIFQQLGNYKQANMFHSLNTRFAEKVVDNGEYNISQKTKTSNIQVFLNVLKILYCDIPQAQSEEKFYEEIKNTLKYNLKIAIYNTVILNKNPDGKYSLTDTANSGNFYKLLSRTSYSENSNNKIDMNNKIFKSYNNLIENISDEFISFLKDIKNFVNGMFKDTCATGSNGRITHDPINNYSIINNLGSLNDVFILKNIDTLIYLIDNTFKNINKHITENRLDKEEFSLTKYIISNYNNIHKNENYKKNKFEEIKTPFASYYNETYGTFLKDANDAYNTEKENNRNLKIALDIATKNLEEETVHADITAKNNIKVSAETNYKNSSLKIKALYNVIELLSTPGINDYEHNSKDYNDTDDKDSEYNIKNINSNANTVSLGIVIVSCIYILLLIEPLYI